MNPARAGVLLPLLLGRRGPGRRPFYTQVHGKDLGGKSNRRLLARWPWLLFSPLRGPLIFCKFQDSAHSSSDSRMRLFCWRSVLSIGCMPYLVLGSFSGIILVDRFLAWSGAESFRFSTKIQTRSTLPKNTCKSLFVHWQQCCCSSRCSHLLKRTSFREHSAALLPHRQVGHFTLQSVRPFLVVFSMIQTSWLPILQASLTLL